MRNGFGEEFIQRASAIACKNLSESKEFQNAETVLLYFPVNNELSPLPLLDIAISAGKTVAFPVCNKTSNTLTFRRVTDLCELESASFGLFEPKASCEEITPSAHTLCIVPALLISKSGARLGYGGGYYDRFLKDFNGTSVGFTYSKMLCDTLCGDAHDVPVDMIITEGEVIYIA